MDCSYKFGEHYFPTEAELDDYLLTHGFDIGFHSGYTKSQEETFNALSSFQISNKVRFEKGPHEYYNTETNERMLSVSQVIEKESGLAFTVTEKGEFSRETGSLFHEIADNVIKNLNRGLSYGTGMDLTDPLHDGWAKDVVNLYKKLSDGGKNVIMNEFMIANTNPWVTSKTRGIAGTVDVCVIYPDGSVSIYDFKGTRHKYHKSVKSSKNQYQLALYKRIMEVGDTKLGLPPIRVRDTQIVPIELEITDDKQADEVEKKLRLVNYTVLGPIPTTDPEYFGDFTQIHANDIKELVPEHPALQPKKKDLDNLDTATNPVFSSLSTGITGVTPFVMTQTTLDKLQHIRQDKVGNWTYLNEKGEWVSFKDVEAQKPGPAGDQARKDELHREVLPKIAAGNRMVGADVINYWNEGESTLFESYNPEKGTKLSEREVQLNKILTGFNKGHDRFVLARDVEGFANVGDDVILIYRNWDEVSQTYSQIDLLSVSATPFEEALDHTCEDGKTSIFSNFATNNELESLKVRMKMQHVSVLQKSQRNHRLLKLGMVALQLKKANPSVKIGQVLSGSYTTSKKNNPITTVSLQHLFDQFKILRELKMNDNTPALEGLDPGLAALVKDDSLLDASQYDQDEANFLVQYMVKAIDQAKGGTKYVAIQLKNKIAKKAQSNSVEDVQAVIDEIRKSDVLTDDLISLLYNRMKAMQNDTRTAGNFDNDPEYKLLAQTVASLMNIKRDVSGVEDIDSIGKYVVLPGQTGRAILDDYAQYVKKYMMKVSQLYNDTYQVEKMTKFGKLYAQGVGEKVNNFVIGNTSRKFEPLMETIKVKVYGSTEEVTRKTGRFWPDSSEEYKKLTQDQKDFIGWYKNKVKEGYEKSMTKEQFENFGDYWGNDWIPLMKSSVSNLLFKTYSRDYGSGSGVSIKDRMISVWDRIKNRYKFQEQYFDASTKGFTEIANFFKSSPDRKIAKDTTPFGDEIRLHNLGLMYEGGQFYATKNYQDNIETNLERVLDSFMMSNIRVEQLSKIIPLYHSLANALTIGAATSPSRSGYDNMLDWLKVYTEATIMGKGQIPNDKAEIIMNTLGMVTAQGTIAFNMFSWTKNFASGHLHTMGEVMSSAMANGDPKMAKAYTTALGKTWKQLNRADKDFTSKLDYIMRTSAMGDMDPERLVMDWRYKKGGFHMFRKLGSVGLLAGDYFHRSHMYMTIMDMDGGVMSAYEKVIMDDGEITWKYNEDKDPRFQDEKGKALKAAVKAQQQIDGTIGEDGRMVKPYTLDQYVAFKTMANRTFESQNVEDQAIYKQWALGRLGLMMNGWLVTKGNRWFEKGHIAKDRGQYVFKTVTKEDGTTEQVAVWEGSYMEGLAQTIMKLGKNLTDCIIRGDLKSFGTYWDNLEARQKQNVYQSAYNLILIGAVMGAVAALLDDEDEKAMHVKLMKGTVSEVFLVSQLQSLTNVVQSPFPTISFGVSTVRNMFSGDVTKMMKGTANLLPPIKVGTQINDFISGLQD